jgi:plasmid replication initiation protein
MKSSRNIDVIQSYILTTARYDYTKQEKRILYKIIEILQPLVKGKKLNQEYDVQNGLFGSYTITFPIKALQKNEDGTNHEQVKKALKSLRSKTLEIEDAEKWGVYGIIEMPEIIKNVGNVKITLTEPIIKAFLNFSKGFRKYELATAFKMDSVYSMRLYELISNKDTPIYYNIEELKKMLMVEKKYKQINDFTKRVIDVAKKELDEKSPYTFDYEKIKEGRKYTKIKLSPIYKAKNRDADLETQTSMNLVSPRWYFDKEFLISLKDDFEMTEQGINNNKPLLYQYIKLSHYRDSISDIKGMIRKYNVVNKAGFFISEVTKFVKDEG